MKKKVIISIKGIYNQDGVEDDQIELVTAGEFYERGGKQYLRYAESEVTGFDKGTVTTLKIDGDVITMSRSGDGATRMVFENGKKHFGYYETPYGTFTVGTMADHVKVNIGKTTGDISLKYSIDINNVPQSSNNLFMTIREA